MLTARKPPSGAVVKRSLAVQSDGYAYAYRIIYTVCCLAGCSSFVDDARNELVNNGVLNAIEAHNTPVLFDWMVRAFSFQGIADAIAADYMDRHGAVTMSTPDQAPDCTRMHRSEQYRYSITSLARVTICGGTVRPLNRRSFSNVIASPDKFIADARKYFLAHDGEAFIRHSRFGAAKERRTRRFDHVVDSLLV